MQTQGIHTSDHPIGSEPATGSAEQAPKYPGFKFCGIRVSYIKADGPLGWGHDEGDIVASNLFSISLLYEKTPSVEGVPVGPPTATGLRVVAGRHSVWFLR